MDVPQARVSCTACLAGCLLLSSCVPEAPSKARVPIPLTTASTAALEEYLKGRDFAEKLRRDEGRQHYAQAAALDPEFAMAHLGLAETAPTPNDLFPALLRAVELADRASQGEAHLIRAVEAGVNSAPDAQLGHLLAAVRAFPEDERAHHRLADYYFGRQEWPRAVAEYRRAITVNPDFSPSWNRLGYALRFLQRFDEAEAAFRAYQKLLPDEPNPYDSHAELLMQVGRFKDAIAEYRKALDVNPNFTPSYVGLGNAYLLLGDFAAASNSFVTLRFLARDGGQRRQATIWLVATAIHQGDHREALNLLRRDLEEAVAADDRVASGGALALMGQVLLDAGKLDEAHAKFLQAVSTMDDAIATREVKEAARRVGLYNQARVALARHDHVTAAALAAEVCQQARSRSIPLETWRCNELAGLCALEVGDAKTAVARLREANPQDPRALFALATAYRAAGCTESSKAVLTQIANFNALSFNLAFVRSRALTLLRQEAPSAG